ncbi:MAG TPA: sugar phosphate isomerase/epimerase family protein [Bacilli bacterium]
MIKGLTQAGLGSFDSFEEFVQQAANYGFGAVDTDGHALRSLIVKKGLDGAKEFLDKHQIQIGTIGLPVEWRSTEDAFRSGLTQLAQDAQTAFQLGCTTCCTYILPSTDLPAAHFMALATRRLRTCAQILGAYNIRLGLEFVGPHHLRTLWANPFIWTLQETLDWIDAIGEPNVGLLFDAYHWYTNELTVHDILALKAEQIVHVHINDAPDVPVSLAMDNGRLYPGEGVIDLGSFLSGLNAIGYKGVVSQEILTPQPPAAPSADLLRRSQAGFAKVSAAAGLS